MVLREWRCTLLLHCFYMDVKHLSTSTVKSLQSDVEVLKNVQKCLTSEKAFVFPTVWVVIKDSIWRTKGLLRSTRQQQLSLAGLCVPCGARDSWLPQGVTFLPPVLSWSGCLCHVLGMPVLVPSCCKTWGSRWGSNVPATCSPVCHHDPGDGKAQGAAVVGMLGSELSHRYRRSPSLPSLLQEDWPCAWSGICIRWESCIGIDLAWNLSGSVPVDSWGLLFSCQSGTFFMCPSNFRVMGNLLTLNYFDIC